MQINEMKALMGRGDYEEVIERLEQVIDEHPLYGPAQILLADAYTSARHDARTVLRAWARALQVVPGSDRARAGLHRALSDYGIPADTSETDADLQFEYENLDNLITELETARIEPTTDLDSIPEPDLDDDLDDMVSPTLARIYAAQNQYGESARVYRKLAQQDAEKSDEYLAQANEMERKAAEHAEEDRS